MPLSHSVDQHSPLSAACPTHGLPAHRIWSSRRGAIPALCGLGLIGAVAAVGGCTKADEFAPACPQLGFLSDGADLSRFAARGRDITDLVIDGHMTAVPAKCAWADGSRSKVAARVQVQMSLARGPAMQGRTTDVPYFIAVTEDGRVLDRAAYAVRAEFPPNTDRISLAGPEVTLILPVTPEKSAAAYRILVSFQLTPEELARNRGH